MQQFALRNTFSPSGVGPFTFQQCVSFASVLQQSYKSAFGKHTSQEKGYSKDSSEPEICVFVPVRVQPCPEVGRVGRIGLAWVESGRCWIGLGWVKSGRGAGGITTLRGSWLSHCWMHCCIHIGEGTDDIVEICDEAGSGPHTRCELHEFD